MSSLIETLHGEWQKAWDKHAEFDNEAVKKHGTPEGACADAAKDRFYRRADELHCMIIREVPQTDREALILAVHLDVEAMTLEMQADVEAAHRRIADASSALLAWVANKVVDPTLGSEADAYIEASRGNVAARQGIVLAA